MKKHSVLIIIVTALTLVPVSATAEGTARLVVLLHGLGRTEDSMKKMADKLEAAGFIVCNVGYPSRDFHIEELAENFVLPEIAACTDKHGEMPVNFITHSLGGIIVRHLRATGAPVRFGRVVMLGPPNEGSELVDKLSNLPPFEWLTGPAGLQLGTGPCSVPQSLGPIDIEVGIIAGRVSINPILSLMIPGKDDGKVAIDNARIEGMQDYLVVPVSHPFLTRDSFVIEQTIHFLQTGRFMHINEREMAEQQH